MEEVEYNPWNVLSLEDFQFYNCPECEDKYSVKGQFIEHAIITHQKAHETLPKLFHIDMESILEIDSEKVTSDLESAKCIENVEPSEIEESYDEPDPEHVELEQDYGEQNYYEEYYDQETYENEDETYEQDEQYYEEEYNDSQSEFVNNESDEQYYQQDLETEELHENSEYDSAQIEGTSQAKSPKQKREKRGFYFY